MKTSTRPSLTLPLGILLACHPTASPTNTDTAPTTGQGSTGALDLMATSPSSSTSSSSSGAPIPTSTEPPITGSSSQDTGAAAVCGDGLLDPDEQCDAGPDLNDEGPCTLDCIHVGVEACDLGVNNSDAYGGCGATCQRNAFCGDGQLDPGEQCDAGAQNGGGESPDATVPCSAGCNWDARLVFLSSELYSGDFGGLDGADLRCRNLAKQAGIAAWPTFRAWLSDADKSPLDRFTLIPALPLVLPTGERIADSLGDLVLNGPRDGIRVDELGKPLPPSLVWTNTSVAAAPFSAVDHCQTWDSASPGLLARVGYSHLPKQPADKWQVWHDERQWTSLMYRACNELARLYCFEN